MYAFKTRTLGQVAVAAVLSMGLTAGAVGIASAATHAANTTSHTSAKTAKSAAFQSVVTTVPVTSVTALSAKGTSETFTVVITGVECKNYASTLLEASASSAGLH